MSNWKYKICGYIYEGETLPKDFTCPICKQPASAVESQARNKYTYFSAIAQRKI